MMSGEAKRRKDGTASSRTVFAWQGLWLELPARWNPIKLEGDYERGYALFADLHRARLGVRWNRPPKPRGLLRRLIGRRAGEFDAVAWSQQAMREEVGMLAAEEAVEWRGGEGGGGDTGTGGQGDKGMGGQGDKGTRGRGDNGTGGREEGETEGGRQEELGEGEWSEQWAVSLLYLEPDPPGRDVWLGFSRESGRAVQVIHHANRREKILANSLLPALWDLRWEGMVPWSVFELSCRVPSEMRLERHVLNAGDLGLIFAGGGRNLLVRQIAIAQLALQRQPIGKWLEDQMAIRRRHYRVIGKAEEVEVEVERPGDNETRGQGEAKVHGDRGGGRVLGGVKQWMRRRRRFRWMWWIPREFVTYALHDETRDRLVMVQGTDEGLVLEVAATVGWAAT